MTVDLHSAVRTAVDDARRLAQAAEERASGPWGNVEFPHEVWNDTGFVAESPSETIVRYISAWHPRRALAMCDWADDVLARHHLTGLAPLASYDECQCCEPWPCIEVRRVAAAFGVETGETP